MRVLLLGAGGMLARDIMREAPPGAELITPAEREADVTNEAAIRRTVDAARADVIVNCAAYTNVDAAEAERERTFAVNAEGPGIVGRVAWRIDGLALVGHYSTDYVFDGSARAPIPPLAPRAPRGVYARGKAEGEAAVERSGCAWTIVRSAWVFGPGGPNFVDTVRAAAREGQSLKVVNDQIGAPTSTRLLTEGLWGLVERGVTGPWHLAASGAASWFEVARTVCRAAGADPETVTPCSTAAAARPAPRPAYSVLDCRATSGALGLPLPAWQEHVTAYVRTGRLPGIGLLEEAAK